MKPINFKHANTTYAKDQPQYMPLPGLKFNTVEGEFIACWKGTWWERIKFLCTGKMWVSLWTFNKPLTPSRLSVDRKEMYTHTDDALSLMDKFKIWLKWSDK